tara:strand:- start:795 stop:1082 length:288 start_codon:yes stop_codon:yes gene_type:complete
MILSCKNKCTITENTNTNNNISKKMLQAQMIRNRKSIEYKSSNTKHIYDTLLSLDDDNIEELINKMNKNVFDKYINRLIQSNIPNHKKSFLLQYI